MNGASVRSVTVMGCFSVEIPFLGLAKDADCIDVAQQQPEFHD
jgi:hypothetical protein